MTATVERRAYHRVPALANRTALEWWDGPASGKIEGRLLDISPGGALMSVEAPISIGQQVWIQLEEPAPTPWIGGRIVRVDDAGSIGVNFHEPCPRDFYETAVLGIGFGHLLGMEEGKRGGPAAGEGPGAGRIPGGGSIAQESDSGTTNGGR